MRVLQLIDTLQPGGAERMAVNYANALVPYVEKSYLCATRKEGALLAQLNKEVGFLFLERKKTIDLKAFIRLKRYIKANKIDIIHAHGSSFFIASVQKMLRSSLVFIWHDHYGNTLKTRKSGPIWWSARYMNAIITVNGDLKNWAEQVLRHKDVHYIKNFIVPQSKNTLLVNDFKGVKGKRIVCVANLRPVKNHGLLLDAFARVLQEEPEATLHLFGMHFNDIYAQSILQIIKSDFPKAYYHGSHPEIIRVLPNFDIGLLSSDSEGLPLALLEYAGAGLATVVTAVGQCGEVQAGHGSCVPVGDAAAMAKALLYYLKNPEEARKTGADFHRHILAFYGRDSILPQVMKIYENALQKI